MRVYRNYIQWTGEHLGNTLLHSVTESQGLSMGSKTPVLNELINCIIIKR